jgi:hypothetical protein
MLYLTLFMTRLDYNDTIYSHYYYNREIKLEELLLYLVMFVKCVVVTAFNCHAIYTMLENYNFHE